MTQIIILKLLVYSILMITLSTSLIQCIEYKYYVKTYNALKNREYVFDKIGYGSGESLYFFKKNRTTERNIFSSGNIIFFQEKGMCDIKLISGGYIYKHFYMYFDPYSLYWLIKFNRWFKKNKYQFKEEDGIETMRKSTPFIKNKSFIKKTK